MNKWAFKSSGFMILEALLAAGIISLSILGLGVGLNKLAQTRDSTVGVSTALAFESGLQLVLQDPAAYAASSPPGFIAALRAGTPFVPHFHFDIPITKHDGTETTVPFTLDGTYFYFLEDGTPCTASASWFFRAKASGIQVPGSTTINAYAVAYRIEFNPNRLILSGIGAPASTFTSNDFKWVIPFEVYNDKMTTKNCNVAGGKVIVTGINRETNELTCLNVGDSAKCAADEIATGWVVDSTPLPHIKMGCRKLNTSLTCPSLGLPGYDYVLNMANPASATGSSLTGQCVFKARASEVVSAATTAPRRSATFELCPPKYKFIPSGAHSGCSFTILQTHLGWQDMGCPSGSGSNWIQNVSPTPLTISGLITAAGAKADREVTCTLVNDLQPLAPAADNWAGYAATLSVSGNCVLSDSEFKPLL